MKIEIGQNLREVLDKLANYDGAAVMEILKTSFKEESDRKITIDINIRTYDMGKGYGP